MDCILGFLVVLDVCKYICCLPSLFFVRNGLVTQEECTVLNELYNYNPLLFDLACKRLLRGPQGESLPASVFKQHPYLPPYNRQQ